MKRLLAIILFSLSLAGCNNCDKMNSFTKDTKDMPPPLFNNGDIVRSRLTGFCHGIVKRNNYYYNPGVNAWCYAVDFLVKDYHFNLKWFPYYQIKRRYVYEYELDLVRSYTAAHPPPRWQDRCFLPVILE